MAVFKCKMCGGALGSADNSNVCRCEYCGTSQTIPSSRDDITANLFNRANSLRLNNDFDKALEVYEKIVADVPDDAEAYWGMVLCKYGIEYVDDPADKRKVPTCHRTLMESVLTDVDYRSAISAADESRRAIYQREAAEIDRLQKEILAIVREEKPFDVFICYKETNERGVRTQDSVIANDIYYQLTQEGLKVFYAAITLEDKLGREYEPYIFAALQSAKVMLVVGTQPEYFQSPWMKNEWSRYLKLMKNDRSRALIPCYRGMDAYDLPEEFSHLQAQDMGRIGFISDIIRGVKKLVDVAPASSQAAPSKSAAASESPASAAVDKDKMLHRIGIFLGDNDFDSASRYCERVLDDDPECAQAYFAKFLAEHSCGTPEALYSQKTITFFATKFISGYGFNVDDYELYLTRINYVLGHSMKNALAFARGSEKDEIEHVYNGLVDMIRNDVADRDRKRRAQEEDIARAARQRQYMEEEKIRKSKNRVRRKNVLLLSSLLAFIIMLINATNNSSTGAGFFLMVFIALLIAGLVT